MRDYFKVPPKRPATLRIEVQDAWLFSDFGRTFALIDSAYLRLSAFLTENSRLELRLREITRPAVYASPPFDDTDVVDDRDDDSRLTHRFGARTKNLSPRFSTLLRQMQRDLPPMSLGRVQVSSPGIIEGIGELNPLAALEHLITNWRAENRLRNQQRIDEEMRTLELALQAQDVGIKQHAQLAHETREALRLASEVATAMHDTAAADELRKQIVARALVLAGIDEAGPLWMNYLLRTADRDIGKLAGDMRIGAVSVDIEDQAS